MRLWLRVDSMYVAGRGDRFASFLKPLVDVPGRQGAREDGHSRSDGILPGGVADGGGEVTGTGRQRVRYRSSTQPTMAIPIRKIADGSPLLTTTSMRYGSINFHDVSCGGQNRGAGE